MTVMLMPVVAHEDGDENKITMITTRMVVVIVAIVRWWRWW